MAQTIGVFPSGPLSSSTSKGIENHTCHNFNKGVHCARTPCFYAHKCSTSGCGKDQLPMEQKNNLPRGWESCPCSTKAPASEKSSFGGVVSPVNVLSNHPERDFINNLSSEPREGARIWYSGPRSPRFSNNLPNAYLNPEVLTANLNDEVSKGRTMGPFSTPPFPNFQLSPIGLVPKKTF